MASQEEIAAMRRALALAATAGVPPGPNPRVGAVIIDAFGHVLGEGFHRGAGTVHAEVDALRTVGTAVRGATAVVTLEPCNHQGRTGPCTRALLDAGVTRVVFAQSDTSDVASGGARELASLGVDVESGVLADEAAALNPRWTFAWANGRPWITWKFATTLDGRIAAPDGTSKWITGKAARDDVQLLRAEFDAIMVGTGTALIDNPRLTVRTEHPPKVQPLRVVVGLRDLPPDAHLLDDSATTLQLRTREPKEVIDPLRRRNVQSVLLEGGSTLVSAFVGAGLVDEVIAYVAPALLGGGSAPLSLPEMRSIGDLRRLTLTDVRQVGDDIKITAVRGPDDVAAVDSLLKERS